MDEFRIHYGGCLSDLADGDEGNEKEKARVTTRSLTWVHGWILEPFCKMAKTERESFVSGGSRYQEIWNNLSLRCPSDIRVGGYAMEAVIYESGVQRREMRDGDSDGIQIWTISVYRWEESIRERWEKKYSRQSLEILKVLPSLGILQYFHCLDSFTFTGLQSTHAHISLTFTFNRTPVWF